MFESKFPSGEEMRKLNKRGVIGFVITMALGVAIGAAALVVGTEMAKTKKSSPKAKVSRKADVSNSSKPSSANQINKAFADYQKAYKDYQQAVGLGREDVQIYVENLQIAKSNLEWEILRNTPGADELDLKRAKMTTIRSGSEVPRVINGQDSDESAKTFAPGKSVKIDSEQHKTGYSSKDDFNLSRKRYEIADFVDESWVDRFQKKYLISDQALTNFKTMSVDEIQSFLEKKDSVLAKPYRGSTPAKMIHAAAQKYGINPQVLLTRLQCEQGLISAKTAPKKKLDWALGIGTYDSGNWCQKYKGLDKQVEFVSATYRRQYDIARVQIAGGKKLQMNIDGRDITVKNAATYAFYQYGPNFAGNKLFYDIWNAYKESF